MQSHPLREIICSTQSSQESLPFAANVSWQGWEREAPGAIAIVPRDLSLWPRLRYSDRPNQLTYRHTESRSFINKKRRQAA